MMKKIDSTAETPRRRERMVVGSWSLLVSISHRLCVSAVIFLSVAFTAQAQLAVKGNTVWTMASGPISNGVVLIKDGKIEAVGPASSVTIPAGYRVINAQFVT